MTFTYFMDDSGNSSLYGDGRYWVLGGIVMPDLAWPYLQKAVRDLRHRWHIPDTHELKWQDVGTRIAEIRNPRFRTPDPLLSVAHLATVAELEQLGREMLVVVGDNPAIRVLSVVCVKADALRVCGGEATHAAANERCYRDMFNDAIERYEYMLKSVSPRGEAFGHLVADQKSRQFDNVLRETCSYLIKNGTKFATIDHLIDGVKVSPSHHSIGLQVADFVAGAIHRWVEHDDDRYLQIIYGNLHTDWTGDPLGAGVKRYPSTPSYGSRPLMLPEKREVLVLRKTDPLGLMRGG